MNIFAAILVVLIGVAGGIAVSLAILVLIAWPVMVLLGVFASMTGFSAFAIGLWPTCIAIIIVRLVTYTVGPVNIKS